MKRSQRQWVLAILIAVAAPAGADELTVRPLPGSAGRATPPLPPPSTFPVQLVLDDDNAESATGLSGVFARQFLWFNQFASPGDFQLEEIWVLFPSDPNVPVGSAVELAVYTDADGDPSNGATLVASYDRTVQFADDNTFSIYPISPSLPIAGGGSVLVGVIPRFIDETSTPAGTSPAALDATATQGRSWIGIWSGLPPDPPVLVPVPGTLTLIDNMGPDGNWMIRAFGSPAAVAVTEIPTLGPVGLAVLIGLLALGGAILMRWPGRGSPWRRTFSGLAIAILAGAAGTPSLAVTIDDFLDPQGPDAAAPGTANGSMLGPPAAGIILGAERDVRVSRAPGAGNTTAQVVAPPGELAFTSDPGASGEALIAWDGTDGDFNAVAFGGLGAVDLTAGGDNAFTFTIGSAAPGTELEVEVFTDAANSSIFRTTLPAILTPTVFHLAFADFIPANGLVGADFTTVGAVTLRLSGTGTSAVVAGPFQTTVAAPVVDALKVDTLSVDADGDTIADPGDTLTYDLTIFNTGSQATDVDASDALTDLTLVGGTVRTSPLAYKDGYNGKINVTLNVGPPGVVANDVDLDGTPLPLRVDVAASDTASTQGGTVTWNDLGGGIGDGAFVYSPPPGFRGVDTFDYTLAIQGGDPVPPSPPTGTVAVTVDSTVTVWFVDATAPPGGDGTQAKPFNNLNDAETASSAGDWVFVYQGSGTTGNGITLKNDQQLIGEGVDLVVDATTVVAGNPANRPTLGNSGGHVVTLADGNTIKGLDVAPTASAGIFGNGAGGTTTVRDVTITRSGGSSDGIGLSNQTGSFTFSPNTAILGTSNGKALALSGGSANFDFTNLNLSQTNGQLIDVNNTSGNVDFTGSTPTLAAGTGGNAIWLVANSGTITLPAIGNLTTTGGGGLVVTNCNRLELDAVGAIDATNGPAVDVSGTTVTDLSLDAVTFASLKSASSPTTGVNLDAVGAAMTVSGATTIDSSTGAGINLNGANGPVVFTTVDVDGTGGPGIAVTNNSATVDVQGGTIGATNDPAGNAVDVDGGTGNVTIAAAITKTTAGRSVEVTNRTGGTVAFTGAIDDQGSGIFLNSNTGATINFTGGLELATGAATAFTATGGGTLNVCATDDCTGAGTPVTNTIGASTALSGTAVNVTDTLIGPSNVTFETIAVDGGGGGSTAIILDDTGSGEFTVTGDGMTAGSGGTIENINADAVTFNNTDGRVRFHYMIIEDIGSTAGDFDARSHHDAIHGQQVDGGLTLDNVIIRRISDMAVNGALFADGISATTWNGLEVLASTIEDSNRFHVASVADSSDEGMFRIVGLTGTVTVDNSTLERGGELLDFFVTSGGTLNMTVTRSTFNYAYKEFAAGAVSSVGKMCIDVTVQGTGAANVTIGDQADPGLGNNFLNCRLASIRVANDTGATGDVDAVIARNSIVVNDHSSGVGGDFDFPMGGVKLATRGEDAATFDGIISHNTFDEVTNADGGQGQVTLDMEDGQFQVRVDNNTFDTPGNAPWFIRADSTQSAAVLFQNNTYIRGAFCCPDPSCAGGGCDLGSGDLCAGINGYCGPGLRSLVQVQNGGNVDVRFDQEDFAQHDVGFDPGNTMEVQVLPIPAAGAGGTACLHLTTNTSPHGYSLENGDGATAGGTFNLQQGASTTTGSCSQAAAANCISVVDDNGSTGGGGNPATDPPDVNVLGPGTISIVAAACDQPSGGIF